MNKNEAIWLKPHLVNKIWGGNRLKEYNYELISNNTGEALIISALNNMSSIVLNKEFNNITYLELFNTHKELFNNYNKPYPLLTKIIDANDLLSVQVHPNNEYAKAKCNSFGKTECWYILDAIEGAEIVYGIKTKNRQETEQLINNNEWTKLLNTIKVKKGDFIFVPSGMVHAIGKGILIYELQQSSNITYRIYDYDRLENNKPRELHILDSLNCIKYNLDQSVKNIDEGLLIDCEYFNLRKIKVNDQIELHDPNVNWLEITVIDGAGEIDGIQLKKGSCFVIPYDHKVVVKGKLELLIAYAK